MAGAGDWSSLPADLLDRVSGHLALERDLLHIRQVCTHWRASVSSRPAARSRPWVLASRTSPSDLGSIGEYSIWLPRGVRRLAVSERPDLPYCFGAPRGWLALGDCKWSPTRLVLWEPSTGAEVALPPAHGVAEVVLSGDPLASPSSGWMAVASQLTESMDNVILFWRPGDAAWTPAARAEPYNFNRTKSVVFHGGKMYCMESMDRIAVYGLSRADTAATPPVLLRLPLHVRYAPAAHLVSCNGDLLLVVLKRYSPVVYKLGPRELNTHRQWLDVHKKSERVTDLGGYSLFLGHSDAYVLSAEEHPAIRGNCIYYVEQQWDVGKKRDWAFVFELKSKKVVERIPFPPEHMENPQEQWWPCSWFCPRKPILLKGQETSMNHPSKKRETSIN